jgi:excisionase family DNA binding protein
MKATKVEDAAELTADGNARVDEACRFLGVGRSTLYVLMTGGDLPVVKIGRCRRIPWRALRQFNAASMTGGRAA